MESSQRTSPTYRDPAIFYTFVFEVGASTPSLLAALKILASDLGLASAVPTTDTVLLAPRYRELESSLQLMDELARFEFELKSQPTLSALRWGIQHPIQFARALGHPSIEDVRLEDLREGAGVAAKRDELKDFLQERLTKTQLLPVISRHTDEKLYRQAYLSSQPFMRIDLQPATTKLVDGRTLGIDVAVLVHRTGVCLLTFYCQFIGDVNHDDVVRWSISSQIDVVEASLPACVLEHRAHLIGTHPQEIHGERSFQDINWIKQSSLEWSMVDLFGLYSDFISSTVREKLPKSWVRKESAGWFSYPIVILRSGDPPLKESLGRAEAPNKQLDDLLLRASRSTEFRDSFRRRLGTSDVSDKTDHSFFLGSSHAILIYEDDWWDRLPRSEDELPAGNRWIPRDFSIVAPVEHLLVQKWILEVAQVRLSETIGDAASARRVRRSVGLVLDELAGLAPVQFGSLQDLVDRGRATLGIDRHLRVLDDQLRWIEGALGAFEVEQRDRSTRRFGLLSIVLTLVLGLPAVYQSVNFLQGWETLDRDAYFGIARLANALTELSRKRPILLTLVSFGSITAVVLMIVVRLRPRLGPRVKFPEVYEARPPVSVVEEEPRS